MRQNSTSIIMNLGTHAMINKPPLSSIKSPKTAAIWGCLLGPIGLGFYFESFSEAAAPFIIIMLCLFVAPATGGVLILLAPFFCGYYGYIRAKSSNAKLDALQGGPPPMPQSKATSSRPVFEAEIINPRPVSGQRPSAAAPTANPSSLEDRLHRIQDLLRKGMISQTEHDHKRQQILSDI